MQIKRTVILPILIVVTLLAILGSVFVFRQKNVTLVVDGTSQILVTRAFTVGNALKAAGVAMSTADSVHPPADSWLGNGTMIVIKHATQVSIQVDGKEISLASTETTPLAWLQAAGLALGSTDRLFVDGVEQDPARSVVYASQHELVLHRPVEVTLIQDGHTTSFTSTALTVAEALSDAGITLLPTDRLDPPGNTPIDTPLTITLLSSHELNILVGGEAITVRASVDTVGAALAQVGLSLQGLDYSLPAAGEPVPQDGQIRVVRVHEALTQATEIIPFDISFQAQAEMDIDTQKVIQFGENGLSANRTRIRFEDGVETSRTVEEKRVLSEPVSQVEGFGTRITVRSMETPDGPVEYYRALDFYATSYHPKMTSPPWYGSVACGGKWQPGYVAVDLHYVPCGTRLYIPGYGFAIAMDTAYISGAWIDLGYPDDAYVSWHWNVTVYFLTPIPAQVSWVIPPGTLY